MSTPGELLRAFGREARAQRANGALEDAAVRTYRGRTVEDVIPLIQRELGAEAIIVRRRDGLTGGVLGFFQHPFVEIEAMPGSARVDLYDEEEPAAPPPPAPAPAELAPIQPSSSPQPPAPQPRPTFAAQPLSAPEPPPAPPLHASPPPAHTSAPSPPPQAPAPAREAGSAYVTAHLAALARAHRSAPAIPAAPIRTRPPDTGLADVPGDVASATPAAPPVAPPGRIRAPLAPAVDFHELIEREEPPTIADAEAILAEYAPAPQRPPAPEQRAVAPGSQGRARAGVEKGLRRVGVSEELARELIEGAKAHTLALAPRAGLAQAVRTTIAQRIPVAPPLPTRGAAIVVVGAGGTGKTTCCAALLGAYRKGSTLPASFGTLTRGPERGDLRLILAPQIVKPLAAGTPRALGALRKAKEAGLAVLDTPRLSPADKAGIRALALLLGELKPERIVVALPATLGAAAAAQLLNALRPLGANALAVTHADETDQIGVAIEAACRFGLAPEYMLEGAPSGGWRLRRIDPSELASRLLP